MANGEIVAVSNPYDNGRTYYRIMDFELENTEGMEWGRAGGGNLAVEDGAEWGELADAFTDTQMLDDFPLADDQAVPQGAGPGRPPTPAPSTRNITIEDAMSKAHSAIKNLNDVRMKIIAALAEPIQSERKKAFREEQLRPCLNTLMTMGQDWETVVSSRTILDAYNKPAPVTVDAIKAKMQKDSKTVNAFKASLTVYNSM